MLRSFFYNNEENTCFQAVKCSMEKLLEKFVYYRHNRNLPAIRIPAGKIFYTDLTFCIKGKLEYKIDNEKVVLSSADAIVVPQNAFRQRVYTDLPAEYISINFISKKPLALPLVVRDCMNDKIKILLEALDAFGGTLINETGTTATCVLLLTEALLIQLRKIVEGEEHPTISKIKRFLNENLSSKITLEDIANLTFYSPVYCDMFFKKHTNLSIIAYLQQQRISLAKRLLREGVLKVHEIAALCGFPDNNYFSKVFKQKTGETPLAYKLKFIQTIHSAKKRT